MLKEIEILLNKILNVPEIVDYTRLKGLTNESYLVTDIKNDKYVIRFPGKGTEKIINRKNEKISTELACEIGIDSKLYYFDDNTGIKITEYIDKSQTMSAEALRKNDNILLIAEVLKNLHSCGVDTGVSFDVISMAECYEKFIVENNGTMYDDYEDVKLYINTIKNKYLPTVELKPCHNDPLCENWLLKDNQMYLIDWEYAGMNDCIWDLADVSIEAEYSHENDIELLSAYFGHDVTDKEWMAFQINKVLIDYLWSLWGKTRAVYEGQEMENYALIRYSRMRNNIEILKKQFVL